MSPALHLPDGSRLDLRSDVYFGSDPHPSRAGLVDMFITWNARRVHEYGPWSRFYGSTLGVLLTLLRAARDQAAMEIFLSLDDDTVNDLAELRAADIPIIGADATNLLARAGMSVAVRGQNWLDLNRAYEVLLGTQGSDAPVAGLLAEALDLTWSANSNHAMRLYRPRGPLVYSDGASEDGGLPTVLDLLECASALDESDATYSGYVSRFAAPRLGPRVPAKRGDGHFDLVEQCAEDLAGRHLAPGLLLALIDFALNPPVPGLTEGVTEVEVGELCAGSRFAAAARAARESSSGIEHFLPTGELHASFCEEIAERTGMRYGLVTHRLTQATSIDEAVTAARSPSSTTSAVALVYADRLHRMRKQDPHLIAHFWVNFLDLGQPRFVDPTLPDFAWWLSPLLHSAGGKLAGSAALRTMTTESVSKLWTSTALTGAIHDAISAIGPLSIAHLPEQDMRDPEVTERLSWYLRQMIRMDLEWDGSKRAG
ncbi:hypothetical protein KDK95_09955 [Actinospica sp. MGRD01-02]|uniref:Uncharacterized protein n=1 Tax=Actinospica acidithermotolerans TaxID=2828514 RepID=A0A941E9S8_9ACTN|nr:hypothetical protein [Actinospica acidithermotolerans]MBR7826628.1 hypothetical protein [Actinospica acidithermotolerans]